MKRILLSFLFFLTAASAEDEDFSDARVAKAAAQTCFRIIAANYEDCVSGAESLEESLLNFRRTPSAGGLAELREKWIAARKPYAISEAWRFSGGPIDSNDGPEEFLNAWPIDEAVIDRVPGSSIVSIIEDSVRYPRLDDEALTALNMKDGEKNITCGWHAVEFLLWGQDTSADGCGDRPFTDFTSAVNAPRRLEFLTASTNGIARRLRPLADEWKEGRPGNFRAAQEVRDADDALRSMVKGLVILCGFELASERIGVPCETRMQEEEHSCFSDTTTADLRGNIQGVLDLWDGRYQRPDGSRIEGISLRALTERRDLVLADEISAQMEKVKAAASQLPERFDQAILEPADGPGQQKLRSLATELTALGEALKKFALRMGRPFSASELAG